MKSVLYLRSIQREVPSTIDSNPSRVPIYAVSHIFPFMWHTDRASDTRFYSEIMAFSSQAILFDLVALSWNERASEIRMG
jgi:hypothetical protein